MSVVRRILVCAVALSTGFHFSCDQPELAPPVVRLDDSTLMLLLTDAFILQSAFAQTYGEVRDSMSEVYTQQLLDKFEISREVYEENMEWLFKQPEKLDSIYAQMLKRAEYLEDRISREAAETYKPK